MRQTTLVFRVRSLFGGDCSLIKRHVSPTATTIPHAAARHVRDAVRRPERPACGPLTGMTGPWPADRNARHAARRPECPARGPPTGMPGTRPADRNARDVVVSLASPLRRGPRLATGVAKRTFRFGILPSYYDAGDERLLLVTYLIVVPIFFLRTSHVRRK